MTNHNGKGAKLDFSGDAPIKDHAHDTFRRWPFAQRVAATIASRRDTSSLVIAINGPWGDGKTTVLNFIEQALWAHDHIVPVKFNPWRFGDEASMLFGFFQQLAEPIGAKLKRGVEKFGEAFQKYGQAASAITLTAGSVQATGAAASAAAALLPVADLEKQKDRIEKALEESGKRVVVFIDDIDRLDKNEIYALFRLLKLTADFACTTYVLAFDEEIVASSLVERYGETRSSSGRSFIEKIVQVPLRLPVVDKTSLRDLCFNGVSQALEANGFALDQNAATRFVRGFDDGILPCLRTPRVAKRYINAISFALPILKDEVDPADVLLVEGLRVFYPDLYDYIRNTSQVFLGTVFDRRYGNDRSEEETASKKIDACLIHHTDAEREGAISLIRRLFPRTISIFKENWSHSSEDDDWEREKRVASSAYFDRFFSYAIPASDVADEEVARFVAALPSLTVEKSKADMSRLLMDRRAVETFLTKLWPAKDKLDDGGRERLAIVLAESGDKFPAKHGFMSVIFSPDARANRLIADSIDVIADAGRRFETAKAVAERGQPLKFACNCVGSMHGNSDLRDGRRFSETELNEIGGILVKRVSAEMDIHKMLATKADGTLFFLSVLCAYQLRDVTGKIVAKHLMEREDAVDDILAMFASSWSGDEGRVDRSEFDARAYQRLEQVVDPDVVKAALLTRYGSRLDKPEYRSAKERSDGEDLANQFMVVLGKAAEHRLEVQRQEAQRQEAQRAAEQAAQAKAAGAPS